MPRKTMKTRLAAAERKNRELTEQIAAMQNHEGARTFAEQRLERTEKALAEERGRRHALEVAEQHRRAARPLSDAELMAVAAAVLVEHAPATAFTRRLTTELDRRGLAGEAVGAGEAAGGPLAELVQILGGKKAAS